ncbi:MAG: hypothetical protein C5B51_09125 [Terriglobia bacterium]|nr:MAG: hypothetical protein C5B51_09125 [Terriglobia bacterium]
MPVNLARVLDRLEKHYGKLQPVGPFDPYEMILYTTCGYPANDVTCPKGFQALEKLVGLAPDQILAASDKELTNIMRLGGIVPEVRAQRLKEIASRVKRNFAGNLAAVLKASVPEAKKALKQFPTIGDPGAEKILLFTGSAPIPAVPSGQLHVLHRLGFGQEKKSYAAGYRSAQESLAAQIPADCAALQRAYLLLQHHGRELCKRSQPRCQDCPVTADCAYYAKTRS